MTSKQELTNIIKKCCDILRTDDGITGAVHYTEVLSWLLYLKFFNDKEKERETLAKLNGEEHHPVLTGPYAWDKWTDSKTGKTGKDLIEFINSDWKDEKGKDKLGLIEHLSTLKSTKKGDPREVIAAIFQNVTNRVSNGYLLKDVIDEVKRIDFESDKDIFSMSHIYEDLLKNMGEGGGNAGEYYTPRPLIKAIVKIVDPQINDKVYDPACGTGGFLAEAYMHLNPQAKTPTLRKVLNSETIFGIEKTPLPYVMCLMNLTLHGLDYPQISKQNTLGRDIRQIEDHEKYNVILANPPFGGKEQKMVQKNFPIESNATEVLFLQHIEKSLKLNGKAAVVVPEGVLFQTGSAYAQFKKQFLETCNVHSIVSLPAGVFLPYAGVKTSVIFFDKTKKTKDVWFYEVKLPDGQRLTKKNGITEDHFSDLLKIYKNREQTENSWLVPVSKIIEEGTNLSASHYNPHGIETEDLLEPEQYAEEIKLLLSDSMTQIDSLINELEES
ncbi:N-6 DNA methylase [Halobacteriovorax sp. ZH1_bin.1]|uniref:class I SAM-dependent DNA methyltransferase n=1 Tax=Halobacteriovorax sp. ZH1_bin.1 TaxID=3157723 RepID=UPI00371AD5CC